MNHTKKPSFMNSSGFTLLELMVVLAIAGLMMALIPPSFERMREGAQYRSTLRAMVSDLRAARYKALAQGVEVRFTVDLSKRQFAVEGQADIQNIPESLQLRVVVADQEITSGDIASIRFLPSGGATGGAIELTRSSGSGTKLVVDWLSGRVFQEPIVSN